MRFNDVRSNPINNVDLSLIKERGSRGTSGCS